MNDRIRAIAVETWDNIYDGESRTHKREIEIIERAIRKAVSEDHKFEPCSDSLPQFCSLRGGCHHACGQPESAHQSRPQHVCGLTGYNPMIDPPCPGCHS